MDKITLLPLRIQDEFILAGGEGRGGKVVARNHDDIHYEAEPENFAYAQHLLRAANSHAALVDACNAALRGIYEEEPTSALLIAAAAQIKAALKLAQAYPVDSTGPNANAQAAVNAVYDAARQSARDKK